MALDRVFETLPAGTIVVGHSVGGATLLKALTEQAATQTLAGLFLIAAPFVGPGGWSAEDLVLPVDLGARLPHDAPIHFFQGLADTTAPPSHVELYARAVPHAQVHRLAGRDHQLDNDLREVAAAIRELR